MMPAKIAEISARADGGLQAGRALFSGRAEQQPAVHQRNCVPFGETNPMHEHRIAQCACGRVELELRGPPLYCLVCYCDDCQAGARQIEALAAQATESMTSPQPTAVLDADGGSNFLMYHKRQVHCVRGAQLLEPLKLRPGAPTNRVVASCCRSAMCLNFDDGRFWVDVFRARLRGEGPPVQQRIFTSFMPDPSRLPRDVPSHPKVSLRLIARLVLAGIAARLRR
jgi:hypothetical protein